MDRLGRFLWRSEDFAHATAVTAGTNSTRVIRHLRDVSPVLATGGAQERDSTRAGTAPEEKNRAEEALAK
jgi:hypothetical protein